MTLVRILGIPGFILLMIYYINGLKLGEANIAFRYAALGLFLVIALTDALDGYLARSRDEVTRLGKMLDPLADKALMLSGLILLTKPSVPELTPQFPIWFAMLVISRDIFLIVGALLIHAQNHHVEVHPRRCGKVATMFLMSAVVLALADLHFQTFFAVVIIAGILTFISGVQYLLDGIKQFESGHHEHRPTPPRN